jgi:hypothetical protein
VEAEEKGFRHFLEVFDPNAPANAVAAEQLGHFMNDLVARTLAGVASPGRPIFLKMVYHGPKAMEELAHYDPHLVPGVLGGSAGTTYDAFKLLAEAKKYGAKAALYGRKINSAEHQLGFIQFLRWIADGEVGPEEAVRAYHGMLQGLGIRPVRPLDKDMQLTSGIAAYGGSGRTISIGKKGTGKTGTESDFGRLKSESVPVFPRRPDGSPDFARMSSDQRLAYHRRRLAGL